MRGWTKCWGGLEVARGCKLTQEEAEKRFVDSGYVLVGRYVRKDIKVIARCNVHSAEFSVLPGHVFKGCKLSCCANESRKKKAREQGIERNPFKGRKHSLESREAISRTKRNSPHSLRGKARPKYLTDALLASITGAKRSKEVCQKMSAHMLHRHLDFDYCVSKASKGKTAGKQGFFYVVRVGKFIKFGSATTTMNYRLTRIRQKHGDDIELLLACIVPDCGEYEVSMMNANRRHWSHGEFFNDFLVGGRTE